MKHAHFMETYIYSTLRTLYRVQDTPKAKLNTPNLNLAEKKRKEDGPRAGRQDVNVHLPSIFSESIISWIGWC